jgi:Trk K+ transport system NAD-binding subunit
MSQRQTKGKNLVIIGMGDTGVLVATRLSRHFNVIGISTKPNLVSGQELGNDWLI